MNSRTSEQPVLRHRIPESKPLHPDLAAEEKTGDRHPDTPHKAGEFGLFRTPLNAVRSCLAHPLLPDAATLPGDMQDTLGPLLNGKGTGLGEIILRAGKLAVSEETAFGRCQWPWGLRNKFVLVTDPDDIKTLIPHKTLIEHDVTGIFELAFGGKTTFSLPPDDPYRRRQRGRLMTNLFAHSALQDNLHLIQEIFKKTLGNIRPNEPVCAYSLVNFIALDIISRTQLGMETFSQSTKERISEIINRIILVLTKPSTHVRLGISHWLPESFKNCVLPELAKLLDESAQILADALNENPGAREIIKGKWLDQEDVTEDALKTIIKMIVMAGHETTTKLLFFALMILGDPDHRDCLLKIRQEVEEQTKKCGPPSQWDTIEPYRSMPYLKAFLHEVLRLYPPIPDLFYGVGKRTAFGNGFLYPGDIVIISPRITHKLASVWGPDASEFHPERFLTESGKDPYNFSFFPFGLSSRIDKPCPGRNLALMEALVGIVSIDEKFDFETSHKVNHETDYYQMVSMHVRDELEENAMIRFYPRDALRNEDALTVRRGF